MTEISPHKEKYQLYSAPVLAILVISYLLLQTETESWQAIAAVAALPLIMWFLIAQTTKLNYLLFLLIPVSVPFDLGGGANIGLPSEGLILLLAAYIFFLSCARPFLSPAIWKHPLVILLLLEIAWMLVCGLVCDQPVVSMKRVFMRLTFVYLFLIFGSHQYTKNKFNYHFLYVLYAVGMVLPIITSFIFHAQFDFGQSAAYRMCAPFFVDHTSYGACIAFLLPTLLILSFFGGVMKLRGWSHMVIVLLTALLVGAVVLSFSRAAWVSLFAAALFGILMLLRVKWKGIMVILFAIGIATWYYSDQIYSTISKNDAISNKGDFGDHLLSATNVQSDASNTERINRWICAWKIANEKPITGCGPGMYQFVYGRYQERLYMTRISTFSGNRGHAHSEYFTQLSETGFPGALLFLAIVFSVIGYGLKVIYAEKDRRLKLILYGAVLGLITFYIHGIFNAFLDTDKMAVLVFGSIAIIVSADIRQTSDTRRQTGANV